MDNSVRVYLPPLYARLTKAMAKYKGQSESSIVVESVRDHFDKMNILEKERILQVTKDWK